DPDAEAPSVIEPQAAPTEPPPHYPFHEPVPADLPKDAPANVAANASAPRCYAEAKKRNLPVKRAGGKHGIAAAMRISGSINGVRFIVPGPKTPYGVFD